MYYRRAGHHIHISKKGKDYRKQVIEEINIIHRIKEPMTGRLRVSIECYPPDKRKRDLDNILKSLFDSLQHAGLYLDDEQIDEIYIVRKAQKHGVVDILVEEI